MRAPPAADPHVSLHFTYSCSPHRFPLTVSHGNLYARAGVAFQMSRHNRGLGRSNVRLPNQNVFIPCKLAHALIGSGITLLMMWRLP